MNENSTAIQCLCMCPEPVPGRVKWERFNCQVRKKGRWNSANWRIIQADRVGCTSVERERVFVCRCALKSEKDQCVTVTADRLTSSPCCMRCLLSRIFAAVSTLRLAALIWWVLIVFLKRREIITSLVIAIDFLGSCAPFWGYLERQPICRWATGGKLIQTKQRTLSTLFQCFEIVFA